MVDVDVALDVGANLGEGALWDSAARLLYWVDITGRTVHLYDPLSGCDRAIDIGQYVGTVVPGRPGKLVLGLHHGLGVLDCDTQKIDIIANPNAADPNVRFNDGKCDPAGRFWAGTISLDGRRGCCSLFCLETDGRVSVKLGGVTNSNGIVWSIDEKLMYYIDTPTCRVDAFDYAPETGAIAGRRPVIVVDAETGHPDGMTIDEEGMLWVCVWGGGRVERRDPSNGRLLMTMDLPVANVTSCAFGGEHLDELYITTARGGLDRDGLKEQSHAGALFVCRPGVRGIRNFAYGGPC